MANIVWTTPALTDVEGIINYIANDSPSYAERVGTHLVHAPLRLQQFPLSGRIVPEFQDHAIRELLYGAYRVIYFVKESTCYIVAVIHGSRDLLHHIHPGEWDIE